MFTECGLLWPILNNHTLDSIGIGFDIIIIYYLGWGEFPFFCGEPFASSLKVKGGCKEQKKTLFLGLKLKIHLAHSIFVLV